MVVARNAAAKSKIGAVIHVGAVHAVAARLFKLKSKLNRLLNIESKKKEYLTVLDYFDQVYETKTNLL